MPKMVVAKPFLLTRNNGERVAYGFGVHDNVPSEDAEHPYAQHFLAPNGKLPDAPSSAPLTHEERLTMKASLDAADERVRAAEVESRAAREAHKALVDAHEQAKTDLTTARDRIASLELENTSSMKEIGEARARADAAEKRVSDLTSDLDKATKPATPPTPPKPPGAK